MTPHKARPHAELSASSAHRWMPCSASVRLTRGLSPETTVYSAEGTSRHEWAHRCLTTDRGAHDFIGETFAGFEATTEAADHVQVYIDLCNQLKDACDFHLVEHQFDLAPLNPPAPMYGTCDFVAYSSRRRTLHVADFKYGSGTWVPVRANPQLLYYGLGAALAIEAPVSRVVLYVVQPRFGGKSDPIRAWSLSAEELAEWSIHLFERARIALQHDAPTTAGDHCRFCPVKGSCVAHQSLKATTAFRDFQIADARAAGT